MDSLVNIHREKAARAFREAIQAAEKRLANTTTSKSIETAKVLLDLAEFHLLINQTRKAETELTDALHHFISNKCEDHSARIYHIIYILKTLSGLHACQGRKHEAKAEERKAQILEEKLNQLN